MIEQFIYSINNQLRDLLEEWPGAALHGRAESITRTAGSEQETLPCLVGKNGELTYIGIDDVHPLIAYHKVNVIAPQVRTTGYGDRLGDQVNTYQNSLIIYFDRKRIGLIPEDLILYIQSNFPEKITLEPFKNIIIRFTGAVLNARVVFNEEYEGASFFLPAEKSFFKINYSIESVFTKDCFKKCPC